MMKLVVHMVFWGRKVLTVGLLILGSVGLGHAQLIKVKGKVSLRELFEQIQSQSDYLFVYSIAVPVKDIYVDMDFQSGTITQVLDSCFTRLGLSYDILGGKSIVIKTKGGYRYIPLVGRVIGEEGESLEGATIYLDTGERGIAGRNGWFRIPVEQKVNAVTVSYVGYIPRRISVSNGYDPIIVLKHRSETPAIVETYGYDGLNRITSTGSYSELSGSSLSRRMSTHLIDSIGRISGNMYDLLTAKVPGLTIRQYNGVPGSDYGVLIRGRHSIAQRTDPLVVVNDVAFTFNDGALGQIGLGSAQGWVGASPLNALPPSSIEKIEVLKDAAAMAGYGSQGSNGVLMVTLNKGGPGPVRWNTEFSSGVDQVVKGSPLLNTKQYLALRKEALQNDGLPVNAATLPVYYSWDTSRSTDLRKMVIGNSRFRHNARFSVSGGTRQTYYWLEGSFAHLSSMFPGSTGDDRLGLYGHLHHETLNGRLQLDGSFLYNGEINRLPIVDMSFAMYQAPNTPSFTDSSGSLVWHSKGLDFLNIPALQHNTYRANVHSVLSQLQTSYKLSPELKLEGCVGVYKVESKETSKMPISGQAPDFPPVEFSYFSFKASQNLQMGFLLDYSRRLGPGQLKLLTGINWQRQIVNLDLWDVISDRSFASGGVRTWDDGGSAVDYKHSSLYSRLSYVLSDRYILSMSGRREVSDRFRRENRIGNFYTAGAAWIFSNEGFLSGREWLSSGKLWANAGTSGNDQVGNIMPVPVATTSVDTGTYNGLQSKYRVASTNSGLSWEVSHSTNLGIDLGFFNDAVLFSAAAYRDVSTNQLVVTTTPRVQEVTAFVNVPAKIVNKGLEFSLQTRNIRKTNFSWTSTVTFTIPSNRLVRFPGLASSPYAGSLAIGKSLSAVRGYRYTGVDATTGLYHFQDINGDGHLDERDWVVGGSLDPRWYGGLDQSFGYKNWNLHFVLDFRIQNGLNPFAVLYQNNPAGFDAKSTQGNLPVEWLDHWRKPGDHAKLQKLSTAANAEAMDAIENYMNSTAQVVDASYVRVKTLMLSYRVPERATARRHFRSALLYVKGQNLWTFTRYPVSDPETQNPFVLPPARTWAMGVKIEY